MSVTRAKVVLSVPATIKPGALTVELADPTLMVLAPVAEAWRFNVPLREAAPQRETMPVSFKGYKLPLALMVEVLISFERMLEVNVLTPPILWFVVRSTKPTLLKAF